LGNDPANEGTQTKREAVRALVVTPGNRVLLLQFREPETGRVHWCPPGGGIEPDETPDECLRRELYEETGFRDTILSAPVWSRDTTFSWAGEQITQRETYHLVRVAWFQPTPRGNPEPTETEAFLGFRWWPVAAIAESVEVFVPPNLAGLLNAVLDGVAPMGKGRGRTGAQ
jgi:8-oxo-dGTP pyrophosphatase MutT (NUDIX family)